MRRLCVVALLAMLAAPPAQSAQSVNSRESDCLFFDAMMHAGKPDLRRYGLVPMSVVYESRLWDRDDARDSLPDAGKLRDEARKAAAGARILVLDIERWPVDDRASDTQFAEHAARLSNIARSVRSAAPGVRLGYFGLFPDTAEDAALMDARAGLHQQWLRVNERAKVLAQWVDVTLPELYTYSDDPARWSESAKRHLDQSRAYLKPVYVFLWPQYAANTRNAAKYSFVSADFWTTQLRIACSYADGVAIWGGWDSQHNRPAEWSADEAWWQATLQYIASVRRRPAGE